MPTADWRLQYPNRAFSGCKLVVHCTKIAPLRGAYNKIVAILWIQEAVMISRKPIIFLAPLALAAACSTTGTYDEPYALVEPGMRSAVRKEMPVSINAVDGQTTLNARYYPTPLTPGKHVIDVYFSTDSVVGSADKHHKTIDLDAAPCTRYRIVARYQSLTHVEWEPVIYPEPIGECLAKFPQKTAQN